MFWSRGGGGVVLGGSVWGGPPIVKTTNGTKGKKGRERLGNGGVKWGSGGGSMRKKQVRGAGSRIGTEKKE